MFYWFWKVLNIFLVKLAPEAANILHGVEEYFSLASSNLAKWLLKKLAVPNQMSFGYVKYALE